MPPFSYLGVVLTVPGAAPNRKCEMALQPLQNDSDFDASDPKTLHLMLRVLAGAGFDKVASGINRLTQSGLDPKTLPFMDSLPLLMAGAGLKDAANSMQIVSPIMRSIAPPKPPPEQQQPPGPPKPSVADILPMLAARRGPGMSGLQVRPAFAPGLNSSVQSPMMGQ